MRNSGRILHWYVLRLLGWFCVIQIAAGTLAPQLNRTPYPQPLDLLVLAFVPAGAFHAARFSTVVMPCTVYGAMCSTVFWLYYLFNQPDQTIDDTVFATMITRACLVTLVLALASRFAAAQRPRWDALFLPPAGHCQNCGYSLTGIQGGMCPECGEGVNEAE